MRRNIAVLLLLAGAAVAYATVGGVFEVERHVVGQTGGVAQGGSITVRHITSVAEAPGGGPATAGGSITANIGFYDTAVTGYSQGENLDVNLENGWNLLSLPMTV